jgi:hypothetical protein
VSGGPSAAVGTGGVWVRARALTFAALVLMGALALAVPALGALTSRSVTYISANSANRVPVPSAKSASAPNPKHGLAPSPSRRPGRKPKRKSKPKPPPMASVSIDPAAPIGPVVPPNFLGLSFEAGNLQNIAGYASGGDLVNLLRSLGQGVLRFGGISVDTEAAWVDEGAAPLWAHTTITPQDLEGIAALAHSAGWRVLLGVTFGHYEPAVAAQEAQVAQSLLGSSLEGIAIGNEPDLYVPDGLRTSPWSFADYASEAAAYRAAIMAAAPGVAIAGPDASSGQSVLTWASEVAAAEHPALLTAHYYPLTKCEAYQPKLSDLVSPLTRANESAILTQLSAIAQASGTPLRVDETNNVSCRGQPGVSNVFASALWAVDYIARAMVSGVAGLNFHDLIAEPESYSPLVADSPQEMASGELHPNPEWYALLLADRLLGDRPVQARVTGGERTLTGAAFIDPDGNVHVVLVNFAPSGARQLLVHLRVPRNVGAGTIMRLTAPGLRATSGVTLGGRAVSPEGTWTPVATLPQVSGKPGALALEMPASSAALVTLSPAR